jgi:hypothetical protein
MSLKKAFTLSGDAGILEPKLGRLAGDAPADEPLAASMGTTSAATSATGASSSGATASDCSCNCCCAASATAAAAAALLRTVMDDFLGVQGDAPALLLTAVVAVAVAVAVLAAEAVAQPLGPLAGDTSAVVLHPSSVLLRCCLRLTALLLLLLLLMLLLVLVPPIVAQRVTPAVLPLVVPVPVVKERRLLGCLRNPSLLVVPRKF